LASAGRPGRLVSAARVRGPGPATVAAGSRRAGAAGVKSLNRTKSLCARDRRDGDLFGRVFESPVEGRDRETTAAGKLRQMLWGIIEEGLGYHRGCAVANGGGGVGCDCRLQRRQCPAAAATDLNRTRSWRGSARDLKAESYFQVRVSTSIIQAPGTKPRLPIDTGSLRISTSRCNCIDVKEVDFARRLLFCYKNE
jgi:hypothetical protein